VFILWGKPSQKKIPLIANADDHLILTASHPSPMSAHTGWFGNKHFSQANQYLSKHGKTPIDWQN